MQSLYRCSVCLCRCLLYRFHQKQKIISLCDAVSQCKQMYVWIMMHFHGRLAIGMVVKRCTHHTIYLCLFRSSSLHFCRTWIVQNYRKFVGNTIRPLRKWNLYISRRSCQVASKWRWKFFWMPFDRKRKKRANNAAKLERQDMNNGDLYDVRERVETEICNCLFTFMLHSKYLRILSLNCAWLEMAHRLALPWPAGRKLIIERIYANSMQSN